MSQPRGDGWIGLKIANGRYTITSKLGEGGMGSVYRARDSNLATDVVVKVPHSPSGYDPEITARFVREASSLVKLSHPHIVRIIDFGEHRGQPFAVMQFLSGGSLASRQESAGRGAAAPLSETNSPETLKDWLTSVAKALDFVHGQGYLHRDVKPANILFDAHGNAFLSDFGITKFASANQAANSGKSLTGAGMVVGTPEYMAPEIILGQASDGRADQYGLAVTVFEMLAGRRPFEDATPTAVLVQQTTREPPDLRSFNPQVPPALASVLRKALSKDPAQRYSSCAAFAEAALAAPAALPSSLPAEIRLECPVCQKLLKLSAKARGRTIACPACKTALFVADDLRELTLSLPEAQPAVARGGTQAVYAGEGGIVPSLPPDDGGDDRASDFHRLARTKSREPANLQPTQPVTAGAVPTARSTVARRVRPRAAPRGAFRQVYESLSPKQRLLIAAGVTGLALTVLVGAALLVMTRQTPETMASRESGIPPASKATLNTQEPKPFLASPFTPPASAPQSVPQASLPPATYFVQVDPPNVELKASDPNVTISGTGSQRRLSIEAANVRGPFTLMAWADGYQMARRELVPRAGLQPLINVRLSRLPSWSKSPPERPAESEKAQPEPHREPSEHGLPGVVRSTEPKDASAADQSGSPSAEWKLIKRINVPTAAPVDSIALSPDGALVAAGIGDDTLQVWEARSGKPKGELARTGPIRNVAFLKDGRHLLCTVDGERSAEIWSLAALATRRKRVAVHRQPVLFGQSEEEVRPSKRFPDQGGGEITCARLSRNEKLLATADDSGAVLIWDVAKGELLGQTDSGSVRANSGGTPKRPGRRHAARGRQPSQTGMRLSSSEIGALAFSPSGKQLASSADSGSIALCDVSTGRKTASLEGHTGAVVQLAYSGDGHLLASIGRDKTLRFWDPDSHQERRPFLSAVGSALAISSDGKWIAAAADNETVHVWELKDDKNAQALPGQAGPIVQLAFSARGTRLATLARDNVIDIWDVGGPQSTSPVPAKPDQTAHVEPAPTPAPAPSDRSLATVTPQSSPAGGAYVGSHAGQIRDDNGLKMSFVWIQPGSFTMGSQPGKDHHADEGPVPVTLTEGFWLGMYEVTQGEWQRAMSSAPWSKELYARKDDEYAASYVSWDDATEFCRKLTLEERRAGRLPAGWQYALPSEAQWEYACRAGSGTTYSFGKSESQLPEYAWFKGNTAAVHEEYAHTAVGKNRNPWGLHNVHGNVAEWCRDWYVHDLKGGTDPEVSSGGTTRVLRGGGWRSAAEDCRSATRHSAAPAQRHPTWGFRAAIVQTGG